MKRKHTIAVALVLGLSGLGLSTGTGSAGAAATEAPSGSQPCGWQLVSNPDTVNVAYPDLDATYWIHVFVPVPGQRLVISGSYPEARYFSLHTYESTGIPLDSAYDAQINPDKGSSNPYRAAPGRVPRTATPRRCNSRTPPLTRRRTRSTPGRPRRERRPRPQL